MKKIIFFFILLGTLQNLYPQNFFLREVTFSDEELEFEGDTSEYSITMHSSFFPTNYRFVFVEFFVDTPNISPPIFPFSIFLYSNESNDTIPFQVCDTLFYEDGKMIFRAYCAIHERDIPGGRDFILKDLSFDFINLRDSMMNAFSILYYDKSKRMFSRIDIHQIHIISPRFKFAEKYKFRKCYCPLKTHKYSIDFLDEFIKELEK